MKKIQIGGVDYSVNSALQEYSIHHKSSSNIAFYGFAKGRMFVQFKNGSSYIYSDITNQMEASAQAAPSIGSFVSREVVGKFPSMKMAQIGVVLDTDRMPI